MILKADLEMDDSGEYPEWIVLVDGYWASGPFIARVFAVDWIYQNGFRQHGGEWVKDVPMEEEINDIPPY